MMSDDIAIKISDVNVSFGNHHVLKGASGEIKKGSIVTFLGRNGCGKSTLLKVLTGNLKPENGSIDVADFGCVLPHAVQNKLNVAAIQLHKL